MVIKCPLDISAERASQIDTVLSISETMKWLHTADIQSGSQTRCGRVLQTPWKVECCCWALQELALKCPGDVIT